MTLRGAERVFRDVNGLIKRVSLFCPFGGYLALDEVQDKSGAAATAPPANRQTALVL